MPAKWTVSPTAAPTARASSMKPIAASSRGCSTAKQRHQPLGDMPAGAQGKAASPGANLDLRLGMVLDVDQVVDDLAGRRLEH